MYGFAFVLFVVGMSIKLLEFSTDEKNELHISGQTYIRTDIYRDTHILGPMNFIVKGWRIRHADLFALHLLTPTLSQTFTTRVIKVNLTHNEHYYNFKWLNIYTESLVHILNNITELNTGAISHINYSQIVRPHVLTSHLFCKLTSDC